MRPLYFLPKKTTPSYKYAVNFRDYLFLRRIGISPRKMANFNICFSCYREFENIYWQYREDHYNKISAKELTLWDENHYVNPLILCHI